MSKAEGNAFVEAVCKKLIRTEYEACFKNGTAPTIKCGNPSCTHEILRPPPYENSGTGKALNRWFREETSWLRGKSRYEKARYCSRECEIEGERLIRKSTGSQETPSK